MLRLFHSEANITLIRWHARLLWGIRPMEAFTVFNVLSRAFAVLVIPFSALSFTLTYPTYSKYIVLCMYSVTDICASVTALIVLPWQALPPSSLFRAQIWEGRVPPCSAGAPPLMPAVQPLKRTRPSNAIMTPPSPPPNLPSAPSVPAIPQLEPSPISVGSRYSYFEMRVIKLVMMTKTCIMISWIYHQY